jgi:hypothetical protein
MILEGIVTTRGPDGAPHLAPMGPRVSFHTLPANAASFVETVLDGLTLRPFRTSQTYRNLRAHPEGVLHVTDDVLLLARAAVGALESLPPLTAAGRVAGWVLADCCRYFEFRIPPQELEDAADRPTFHAEIVGSGRRRDFFGLNRAKHAVVEAAILATRTAFLPLDEIEADYRRLAPLVEKTGGEQERTAFAFLQQHLARLREQQP